MPLYVLLPMTDCHAKRQKQREAVQNVGREAFCYTQARCCRTVLGFLLYSHADRLLSVVKLICREGHTIRLHRFRQ